MAQAQVKAGLYTSVSEVIRDALRQQFMSPLIPTFKMSPHAETVAAQAEKDYLAGNVVEFTDINELLTENNS